MFRRALLAVYSSMSAVSVLKGETISSTLKQIHRTTPEIHREAFSTQSERRSDVIASSASPIDVVFDLSFVWHQQATFSNNITESYRCRMK